MNVAGLSDDEVEELIATRYREFGHTLGWSMLYCPQAVRLKARVATLGLNPGGGRDGARVSNWEEKFSIETGNAYQVEDWTGSGRKVPLQLQILKLAELLETSPCDLLSANVVPFRSPDWESLREQEKSKAFGLSLLPWLLQSPFLRVVVMFGLGRIERDVVQLMNARKYESVPTGWGKTVAHFYRSERLTLVGLPHLSRYRVFGRSDAKGLEDKLRQLSAIASVDGA